MATDICCVTLARISEILDAPTQQIQSGGHCFRNGSGCQILLRYPVEDFGSPRHPNAANSKSRASASGLPD
eukprot:11373685-Alexandrium_andersonii.AAC.1